MCEFSEYQFNSNNWLSNNSFLILVSTDATNSGLKSEVFHLIPMSSPRISSILLIDLQIGETYNYLIMFSNDRTTQNKEKHLCVQASHKSGG